MTTIIKDYERGLVMKNGNFHKYLKPGKYRNNPFQEVETIVLDTFEPFIVEGYNEEIFLKDEGLIEDLEIVEVADCEIVLHYINGNVQNVLKAGKHIFWNISERHTFVRVDMREPLIDSELALLITRVKSLNHYYQEVQVEAYEQGVLFYDGVYQKTLEAGRYFFFKTLNTVNVVKIDTRLRQIDMTGQEIMTLDKVTLRLNFVCQYNIVDPVKVALDIKGYESQLYILLQLVLREYVGMYKLDDLLKQKEEIAHYVLDKLKAKEDIYGIKINDVGVKDIILPGEIKDILNTVILAEKKAAANVIKRREEVASTRSLLNTAKLMDENKTLYKLKELEHLENICDKIGHVSLEGGGNVLAQLKELFAS